MQFAGILTWAVARQSMWEAWVDSQADDPDARHEEGGYFVRNADGSVGCERWPRGYNAVILPPQTPYGQYNGKWVISEFHTHPNPAPYVQGPSPADLHAIIGEAYEAESYVVARNAIYRVEVDGSVNELPIAPASLSLD